jgi:hypothetical protein
MPDTTLASNRRRRRTTRGGSSAVETVQFTLRGAHRGRPGAGTPDGQAAIAETAALTAVELEHLLDQALGDTFPASDPLSVVLPWPKRTE